MPKIEDSDISPQVLLDISLSVPAYSQKDSRWANDIVNGSGGKTIGDIGCALTSVAMVLKYHRISATPATVNDDLGNDAYNLDWGLVPSKCANNKVSLVTLLVNPTERTALSTAVGALEDKNPVIIGFEWYENGKYKSHFVVIKGVYGDGRSLEDFTIIDALNGNQRSLSYYSGKSIQRVIVYKKK